MSYDGLTMAQLCVWQTVMFDDITVMVMVRGTVTSLLIITCQPPVSPSLVSFTFLQSPSASSLFPTDPLSKNLAILKEKQVPDLLFTHHSVWMPFIAVAESDTGQMIYQSWHLRRSEITTGLISSSLILHSSRLTVWECIFMRWSRTSQWW